MAGCQEHFSIQTGDSPLLVPLCTIKLKNYERRKARISQGMSPEPDTITERHLGLSYEPIPKLRTRAELRTFRKLENSLYDINSSSNRFETQEERLSKREEKYRVLTNNGQTLKKLIEQRKIDNIEYHSKVFGHQKIGIHSNELPKFSKHKRDYWGEGIVSNNFGLDDRERAENGKRYEKSFEKEITRKPNETSFSKDQVGEVRFKYGKKFLLSKMQAVVLKYFKVYENTGEIKNVQSNRNKNRTLRAGREMALTPQIQVRHIRSSGFREDSRALTSKNLNI